MTLVLLETPSSPGALLHRVSESGRRRPRIAMIEDDQVIATMYRLQLEADGFDVVLAVDGIAGLHLVQERPPDLILLDIRLPGMQGLEVLRTIQGDPRLAHLPVLLLSNYGEPGMIQEGLELGARDYLIKSQTTPVELTVKLRQHLPPPD